MELWSFASGEDRYSITLGMDRNHYDEGDLVLEYREGDTCLFDLAFTFAPGHVVDCGAARVMLVARVQGRPHLFEAIRRATKACGDIFPAHVLVAAAEGVASATSTSVLCGVRTEHQPSSRWGVGRFNYDGFWAELLAEPHGDWHRAAMPLPRKPLAEVPTTHRRRAKRKRLFKDAVAGQVTQAIAQHLR